MSAFFDAITTPDSPACLHGHLHASGSRLLDAQGQAVRLRGCSLFWSQWQPWHWNIDCLRWLRDDWGVTVVRAAMGIEHDGYLDQPDRESTKLHTVVTAAVELGIYVIIDWHDHNAEQHVDRAIAFFDSVARMYGRYPNVLFETFNEPVEQSWTSVIKPYHSQVLTAIRQHSSNLVILGTRRWSQEVAEASDDPLLDNNIAYALHFYSATHKAWLRQKVELAIANGVLVFASEWGTCSASGDGPLDLAESAKWLAFLEHHQISDVNWAVSDKAESASSLRPGAMDSGLWSPPLLTDSGEFVRNSLRDSRAAASNEGLDLTAVAYPQTVPEGYFRIVNRWKADCKLNVVHDVRGLVLMQVDDAWWSAMWRVQHVDNGCVHIVNRWKPEMALNVADDDRVLAVMVTKVPCASALWRTEFVDDGYWRLVNKWKPDLSINAVHDCRTVTAMPVKDDWWSAMWLFQPTGE